MHWRDFAHAAGRGGVTKVLDGLGRSVGSASSATDIGKLRAQALEGRGCSVVGANEGRRSRLGVGLLMRAVIGVQVDDVGGV